MDFRERLIYGVLGLVFGALVGAIVFWLLGVYSRTLGPTGYVQDARLVVGSIALAFGLVGCVFGASTGTAVGRMFGLLFEFESIFDWPKVRFLMLVFGAVAVWFAVRA